MSRLLRIAWREYLAYVRTVGFWLSIILLPVGIGTFALAPVAMERSTPPPSVAVVDFTGRNLTPDVAKALAGDGGAPIARLVPAPGGPFTDSHDAVARLKPQLSAGAGRANGNGLDAFIILRPSGDSVAADLWSHNVTERAIGETVNEAVTAAVRRTALTRAGVDPRLVESVAGLNASVTQFSPRAARQKVMMIDRVPGIAGLAMGMLLWMSILTGAGMLLNSIIEEKGSKILEVLLSSASAPEIMLGKIFGVAAVTGTVLSFWVIIGLALVAVKFPHFGGALISLLWAKGLLVYFGLYFIGGYLMFATLYVTVGAFCESPREAQILMGPMMILMSIPLVFMSQAVNRPDAPILVVLSFIPPFTPFIMAARSAAEPPLWQIASTLTLMFAFTALEIWIAIPAFRSGALTSGRFDLKVFVAGLRRRGER